MSANTIQVNVEKIRREHFSGSKTRDSIMSMCDKLESRIIKGHEFSEKAVEEAVNSGHIIRGNLQSIYVRVETRCH